MLQKMSRAFRDYGEAVSKVHREKRFSNQDYWSCRSIIKLSNNENKTLLRIAEPLLTCCSVNYLSANIVLHSEMISKERVQPLSTIEKGTSKTCG